MEELMKPHQRQWRRECCVASKAALNNKKEKKAERFWSHIILKAYLIHLDMIWIHVSRGREQTEAESQAVASPLFDVQRAFVRISQRSDKQAEDGDQWSVSSAGFEKQSRVFNFLTHPGHFRLGAAAGSWRSYKGLFLNSGCHDAATPLCFNRLQLLTVKWKGC